MDENLMEFDTWDIGLRKYRMISNGSDVYSIRVQIEFNGNWADEVDVNQKWLMAKRIVELKQQLELITKERDLEMRMDSSGVIIKKLHEKTNGDTA